MILRITYPLILLATLCVASSVSPLHAASVADKVEQAGQLSHLKVNTIRVARRNDFLNIQAEIFNTSNSNQQLYYRFKWLDDAGFTVGAEEGWKPLIIYGGQKKRIETVAPLPSATDFRIEMNSPANKGVSDTSTQSN